MSHAQIGSALTHDNVKFIAIARATDKAILCAYLHNGSKKSTVDMNEMTVYREMLSKVIRAPTWTSQVAPNGRHSLECDPNKFHFTMDKDELVYIVITAKEYPIRLAFQLLSTVQQDIRPNYGSKALTCKEDGLDRECIKTLGAIAAQFDDRTKVDKISEVMNQVDSVKNVMHDNIQVVLSTTEKMEVVEQKTNDLNEQAKMFRNSGKKLRSVMWWKNAKVMIAIGLLVVFAFLIILAMAGAFKKSSPPSTTPPSSRRLLRF